MDEGLTLYFRMYQNDVSERKLEKILTTDLRQKKQTIIYLIKNNQKNVYLIPEMRTIVE